MMASFGVDVYVQYVVRRRDIVVFIHISAVCTRVSCSGHSDLESVCVNSVLSHVRRTCLVATPEQQQHCLRLYNYRIPISKVTIQMQITYIYWDQSQCRILRNHVAARVSVLTGY